MPHVLISPLVKWGLAVLGGAVVIQWVVAEVRRVNEELEARRARVRVSDDGQRQTLRRDPVSGEYRL